MIHFFRRIRQGLVNQERIGKYLLYAIGEILLVVIGILLALQINNWNEESNIRAQEMTLRANIIESVKKAEIAAEQFTDAEETNIRVTEKLLKKLKGADNI